MTREQVTQRVPQSDRDKATPRYRNQAERQSVREKKKNNNWQLPVLGQGQPWAHRDPAQQLFCIGVGGWGGWTAREQCHVGTWCYCNNRHSCYSLRGDRLGVLYPPSLSLGSKSPHSLCYDLHRCTVYVITSIVEVREQRLQEVK